MSDNMPGFNPKKFTDEQLLERAQEITRKMVYAANLGYGGLETLQMMLDLINTERTERSFMQNWTQVEDHVRASIETDPEHQAETTKEKKQHEPKLTRFGGLRQPVPTSKPQSGDPAPMPKPVATTDPVLPDSTEDKTP